jgi:large subunit ribosomal protein L19
MQAATIRFTPVNTLERKELDIRAGDTVRVWQKIQEGDKTRLQAFEGIVLARKHGTEPGATFTVRRVIDGIGVERTFPLYSPVIDRVETIHRGRARRAKLYYIRTKAAKDIRRQMRRGRAPVVTAEVAPTTQEVVSETAEVSAEST